MTKKELVELLNENYADEDEVFASFQDINSDQCVGRIGGIMDVEEKLSDAHYEVFQDGKWFPMEDQSHTPYYLGYQPWQWRMSSDNERIVKKKCIVVM